MKELCLAILGFVARQTVTVTTRLGNGTVAKERTEKHACSEPTIYEEFIVKYPIQEIDTAIRLLNMKGQLAKNGLSIAGPYYYSLTESGWRVVDAGEFEQAEEKLFSAIPTSNYHVTTSQLSEIKAAIDSGFADTSQSLITLQSQLSQLENETLGRILNAIHQGQIEQGELSRTLDAIRRVLRFLQSNTSEPRPDIRDLTEKAEKAINSEIGLQQKLELTLPVIPFFLNYKVELEMGSKLDLEALQLEAKERWAALDTQAQGRV